VGSDLNLIQRFASIINCDIMNTPFTYLSMVTGETRDSVILEIE